jgi:serine/threonine protein kinase
MDKYKAGELAKFLSSETLEEYRIQKLINFGKSAAVFEGVDKDGSKIAIKVFDADLIDKFGGENQQRRIQQEISLKDHNIEGLVKILDGGIARVKDIDQHFLVMEFIAGQNLKDYSSTTVYDENFIRSVLNRLFDVSEALLKMSIVHRDIKPENIMVSAKGDIILMDLGVIKHIGTPSDTDVYEPQFLGTLRYAPPEYLRRKEEDTPAGWKAVNLYQIGAVLHDLIMKTELFHDKSPYANIVIAVKEDAPVLEQGIFSFDLVQLVRDMLIKIPEQRLRICSDDRIQRTMHSEDMSLNAFDTQLEKLKQLISPYTTHLQAIEDIKRDEQGKYQKRKNTLDMLTKAVTNSMETLKSKQVFSNYSRSQDFQLPMKRGPKDVLETNRLYVVEANISKGLPYPVLLIIHEEANENDYVKLEVAGFVGSVMAPNVKLPVQILSQLPKVSRPGNLHAGRIGTLPSMKEVFSGILQKPSDIEPFLINKFMSLILEVVDGLKPIASQELAWQESLAKGAAGVRSMQAVNQYYYCD